jgi:Restriction endonuclease AspBHI N-terminal/Restriction endonuclease
MQAVRVPRDQLSNADLILDAVYEGGRAGNAGDDPLGPLLGVSNQGGFRHLGRKEKPNLLVITTSLAEPDWPDGLDLETGRFTYYGDNRRPGRELHRTPRWGNQMLRDLFERLHSVPPQRESVAPTLVFSTVGTYRDVKFLGLAVPGASGLTSTQDLVALWRHVAGARFQNYRATFTILRVAIVRRQWLRDICAGKPLSETAPPEWLAWVKSGQAEPLRSSRTIQHRTRDEQLPSGSSDKQMLAAIRDTFAGRPHDFEACAAAIAELLLPGIVSIDLTRASRDGGRDAIGKYRIGSGETAIDVEFALEAKCYGPEHAVSVKDTARLISRLRHRQFGILVTTSYIHSQAYKEIKDDQHPVVMVTGADIVAILKGAGVRDKPAVETWVGREGFRDPVRLL